MDIEKAWNEALKRTEIIRSRIQNLMTTGDTLVPYVFLSESAVNLGDTVVRKGEILVTRPSLIVPPNNPQFYGFDFDLEDSFKENSLINFLLVRGITLPSMRYDNRTSSLDIFEGKLSQAIKYYSGQMQQSENVKSGLIAGPEEYWQLSLLIFICSQIARNADTDIKKLLENYRKQIEDNNEQK